MIYGAEENPLRAEIAFHDGANSKNTDFTDVGSGANFGVGGRAEYKVMGDWKDYRDFTAKGSSADLLVIGAGAEYTETGDSNVIRATIDAQYEIADSGWSFYGAGIGVYADGDDDLADDDNYGVLGQVGYAFNPSWEVFGRYSVLLLDEDLPGTEEDTFNEVTVGVNWYLGDDGSAMHNAKVTLDLVWLPDGAPGQSGLGYIASDEQQFVLRGQFQLAL